MAFEGEYKDGKKWNGKGYDNKNNIIYELNDGKGIFKIYDYYRDMIDFEGEYINGEINGKGKKYFYGNLRFEGEFFKRQKIRGKEFDSSGKLIFEGEYLNDDGPEAEPFDSINNTQKNEYLSENRCKGKEYDI